VGLTLAFGLFKRIIYMRWVNFIGLAVIGFC